MRDNINIFGSSDSCSSDSKNNFNPLELIKDLIITDITKSSVSYA